MATESGQVSSAAAIALATDPTSTPFDYIVIGSGAGGGPLAARLAINGRRVLVIEAGGDPGAADAAIREVYDVPAYNAAATEDPQTSWDFSVRHYENDERQRADSKYTEAMDPSTGGGAGKGGIFYPRAAALGGCTSHHAMIMIRPNDSDWDDIARATGDDSWRSENMQGYFPKIEQCLYYAVYKGFLGGIFGGVLRLVQAGVTLINPRLSLDPNGHGFNGWQPTSFIDPLVIAAIARGDRTFLGLIFDVIWSALGTGGERSLFKRALAHLQVIQFLDPNVRAKDIDTRARLSLISIGTDGKARFGLREWLLKTVERHPQHLVLMKGAHATRLVFARDDNDPTPRVIGVEVTHGEYLYKASKRHSQAQAGEVAQYFARAEVVVCGGSFNTPQLLMLSGIGDAGRLTALDIPGPRDREGTAIAPVVDLPGVGRNLQDRYEVSVVCEMKREFSTLKGATYQPGDANDPIRAKWLADKTGLYGTNGGALAMMLSSSVSRKADPDIFVFGVPAAFRGYYWNWSKELLWRTKGVGQDQRNLWTWVILKAYTDNNHGTVTLRSADPFDTPDINFHSFSEGPSGYGSDVDALCDAVQRVRDINAKIKGMAAEVQPGASRGDGPAMREWVQDEAWGHHACGTCRIGPDTWRADSTTLVDRGAVLDSQFRVHGVRNLRVVDASVFSRIPGYFIVTPVFMISEKAADVLLADRPAYPSRIEEREAAAIHHRRQQLSHAQATATAPPTSLPKDCIGLALSGGGVRSSTYCLGVIQALAKTKILPRVDILSSASGGGYVGGFLGRLYTRLGPETLDKPGRVAEILSDATSPEIWWLRRYADYLVGGGRTDVETDLAIIARNLVTVLFCIGTLLLAGLSVLRWIADGLYPRTAPVWTIAGIAVSPWWPVAAAILAMGVLPIAAGYWLTPNANSRSPYSRYGLAAWAVSLGCAIAATAINGLAGGALVAIGILLLAWFWQEVVRWRAPRREGRIFTTLYRNRLSRALGTTLFMLLTAIAFIIIDSLARTGSTDPRVFVTAGSALLASPLLMFFRSFAIGLIQRNATQSQAMGDGLTSGKIILAVIVFAVATLLFFAIDVLAHSIFATNHPIAVWMTLAAAIFSLAIGRGINFINLSSLQQSLTQKLTRTFLGASNDARVHPTGTDKPVPIQVSEEADDVWLSAYHPEENGGPLHLVNVCVNQTVDHISGRQLPQNKGLPMCLGPAGISVGAQYHAVWEPRRADLADNKAVIRAIPVAADPHQFHVLARSDRSTATVEQLSLGRWLAISAASVSTGAGRNSSLPLALLLGLLNIRLGYWWDSGIYPGQRPGRYPPGLWRRIKSLPSTIFAVQAMLLDEWRAYFQGPSAKRWYLSDGGHFDNTGLYELIRRRLPFIIAIDGSQDERYEMGDLAILMRQVRLDFGAELNWLDPGPTIPGTPWKGFDEATLSALLPSWITALIRHPGAIGSLASIRRDGPACAALARIHYAGQQSEDSWLLLIKASLAPEIPVDVRNYAVTHPSFPNQPTSNQFFADDQWESYRALGERAGLAIF